MKRPAFQFYPADWRNNAKLRRCSEAARGVWMDVLCVLHDSDEYGVCRWPLADLARAANAPLKLVKELAQKDVLKGSDKDPEPYVYTPRHAGKDGDPVTLVTVDGGPCWYSSRFVRDEWVRGRRGSSTHFGSDNQPPNRKPKQIPKSSPKVGFGERQGDGPTSTSSTSFNTDTSHTSTTPAPSVCVDNSNPSPTPAGLICKALKAAGMPGVSPQHPELLALIERGVTEEMFAEAAKTAVKKQKDFAYMLGILKRQLESAANIGNLPAAVPHGTQDIDSRAAVEAEGVEKGFGKWDENKEHWHVYKARVRGKTQPAVDPSIAAMVTGALKSGAPA